MSRRTVALLVGAATVVLVLLGQVAVPAEVVHTHSPPSDASTPAVGIAPDYLFGYSITAVPGSGLLNESLSVTAKSSQSVSTFRFNWTFGDGSSSINVSVAAQAGSTGTDALSHIYPALGQYNVSVRISDLTTTSVNDKPQNATRTVTVSAAFAASLTPSYTVATSGTVVNEDPIVSGGAPPYSAVWTGTAPGCSTVPGTLNLTCLTVLVGTYHPSVTVSDTASNHKSLFGNFTINPALTIKPGFVPWYDCNGGVGTLQENFTSGAAGGTNPITFVWNFGDGTPNGSTSSVPHLYVLGPTYHVLLTVNDSGGARLSNSFNVSTLFPACSGVGSPNYQPPLIVLQGGVVALVVAIVVLLLLLRRSRPGVPLAPPQPYVEPKKKPDEPAAPPSKRT